MTLLTIAQNISKSSKVPVPNSIIGNTNDVAKQLFQAIRISTEDILQTFDWQVLQKEKVFASVASTEGYDLPSDFERIIDNTFWDSDNNEQLIGSVSPSEWRYLKNSSLTPVVGNRDYYRIRQNDILLYPTPTGAVNYIYEYISDLIIISSLGVAQNQWIADTDSAIVDELLIELNARWKFLRSIGKEYAEAQTEYVEYLKSKTSSDSGRRTIQHPIPTFYNKKIAFTQNVTAP